MARKKIRRSRGSRTSSPGDRLLHRLAEALDNRRISYVVIGGQAVNQHGHSRFTGDIDFTVHLPPWDVQPILDVTSVTKVKVAVPDPASWVAEMHVLPCRAERAQLGVDFSFVPSPYIEHAISRSVKYEIDGYGVRFLAIEDLLLQKVIANRPQDRIDVIELAARHSRINEKYIRDWLRKFEEVLEEPLVERFDDLLKESKK